MLKRRSMCAFTCVPRPRMNRPPERAARSQAACATTTGLRAKAIATDVPTWAREVCSAIKAREMNGPCDVSRTKIPSKPHPSSVLASSATRLRSSPLRYASTFTSRAEHPGSLRGILDTAPPEPNPTREYTSSPATTPHKQDPQIWVLTYAKPSRPEPATSTPEWASPPHTSWPAKHKTASPFGHRKPSQVCQI
jgi:hypothetical protein